MSRAALLRLAVREYIIKHHLHLGHAGSGVPFGPAQQPEVNQPSS
jgi:hypothetical protein